MDYISLLGFRLNIICWISGHFYNHSRPKVLPTVLGKDHTLLHLTRPASATKFYIDIHGAMR